MTTIYRRVRRTFTSKYREPGHSPIEISFWEKAKPKFPELEREVRIGKYRVDFLIRNKKVIIELYGYKYHKTKEKLTHDAERERYLQKQGYQIIRFTGTEVYNNSQKCVQEVIDFLRASQDYSPTNELVLKTEIGLVKAGVNVPAIVTLKQYPKVTNNYSSKKSEHVNKPRQFVYNRNNPLTLLYTMKSWQRNALIGFIFLDVMVLFLLLVILFV